MRTHAKLIDSIKANPVKYMFFGWILAFVIPLLLMLGGIRNFYGCFEISFLSLNALFTGFAFAVTYLSLKDQKEHLNKQLDLLEKQTKMDVFSEVSEELGSEDFKECRKYINSSSFDHDIKRIKQQTQKEEICLQDIKDICYKNILDGIDEEEKQHLQNNYQMIIRFCSKMEYLGFIYYHTPTDIIVDYYGRTILNMYKRLKPLIEIKSGKETKYIYYHFAYLYNFAMRREKGYYEERDKVIKNDFVKEFNNQKIK